MRDVLASRAPPRSHAPPSTDHPGPPDDPRSAAPPIRNGTDLAGLGAGRRAARDVGGGGCRGGGGGGGEVHPLLFACL
jgi:hypothetical protein